MTRFLAGVLSVIAIGILTIAYSLLTLSASPFDPRQGGESIARPLTAGDGMLPQDPYAVRYVHGNGLVTTMPYGYAPYSGQAIGSPTSEVRPIRTGGLASVRQGPTRTIDRQARRDWRKTALVIGGSTAGAAGVGAIFGGKKGALIGAAIGGGASTIYEATKR
jgi:hypothetical protein